MLNREDRLHNSVWIIEATGKINQLTKVLDSMNFHSEVIATRGHFCKLPDDMNDIGIDKNFAETKRIANQDTVDRIRESINIMIENGGHDVYIASDDDTEGNVIAYDIFEAIKDIFPTPLRVKLTALDKDSIQSALDNSSEVKIEEAITGRTRAIIDRVIGLSFSNNGIAAGRVGSAILGIIAKEKPKPYRLNLITSAIDGGRVWKASSKLTTILTKEIADKLVSLTLPPLDYESVNRKITPPNDMGRILVRSGDELNLSPTETAKALQSAYESGSLSYPRASSHGMSKSAAQKISQSFAKAGWKFDKKCIPEREEGEPHDSPYPIGPVDISLDPKKLGPIEGLRVMIARDLLPCGEKRKVQQHKKGILSKFLIEKGFSPRLAEEIDSLNWERDFGQPLPGAKDDEKSNLEKRRIDVVILESCLSHNIGKPSTWPNHIQTFIDRGLIDDDILLTHKGERYLSNTPDLLLNPKFSQVIMSACESKVSGLSPEKPWEDLAKKIVEALPDNIKSKMIARAEEPISSSQKASNERNILNYN